MDSVISNSSEVINGVALDSTKYAYEILHQNVTLLTVNGIEYFLLTDFDAYYKSQILWASFLSIRIGCSAIATGCFFLLVKDRRRPIYICNMISLILIFLHSTLFLSVIMSTLGLISTSFTNSFVLVGDNCRRISIAASLFQICMTTCIEVSFILQVRSVFPQKTIYRTLATLVILLVGLNASVINFLNSLVRIIGAVNDHWVLFGDTFFGRNLIIFSQISFLVSVVVTSAVLFGKLLFALRMRKVLGLRQFGAMEMIFIMTIQTMILPVVMSTISFAITISASGNTYYMSGFSIFTPLLVVLSLPMSSIWAASANVSPSSRSELTFSSFSKQKQCLCKHSNKYNGNGGNNGNGGANDFNRSISSYSNNDNNNHQNSSPSSFMAKFKKVFHSVDAFFIENGVKSLSLANNQTHNRPHNSNDIESLAGEDEKCVATTMLSISNIDNNNRNNNSNNNGGNNNNNSRSKSNPKTPSTVSINSLRSGSDSSGHNNGGFKGKSAYVNSAGVLILNPSSPTDTIVNRSSYGELYDKTQENSSNKNAKNNYNNSSNNNGLVSSHIAVDGSLQYPASPVSPTTIASRNYSMPNEAYAIDARDFDPSSSRYNAQRHTEYIESDLLSLNDDENEEEYYFRMKSGGN